MQITSTQRKAIDHYYNELEAYHTHKVTHETAVRSAFQNLLASFAQSANWTLIPEQTLANGKRPDGTLRDTFNLPRGYWEARDTRDDLNIEIRKKINAVYPITNTIFEDTRRAVLYQNNKLVLEADLKQPKELTNVLDTFFHYAEPDIATFEHAVKDFKESIPDLAQGLMKRIKEEHAKNKSFVAAFASSLDLCRTSLDPNMSSDTVDEMLRLLRSATYPLDPCRPGRGGRRSLESQTTEEPFLPSSPLWLVSHHHPRRFDVHRLHRRRAGCSSSWTS